MTSLRASEAISLWCEHIMVFTSANVVHLERQLSDGCMSIMNVFQGQCILYEISKRKVTLYTLLFSYGCIGIKSVYTAIDCDRFTSRDKMQWMREKCKKHVVCLSVSVTLSHCAHMDMLDA